MRAGGAEAREIKRVAPRQPVARFRDALVGKGRAEAMKACAAHGLRRKPLRQTESGLSKPWMSRANSFLFQAEIPSPGSINHKWLAATMPFRGAEKADLNAR
jgi:hypothetical protein